MIYEGGRYTILGKSNVRISVTDAKMLEACMYVHVQKSKRGPKLCRELLYTSSRTSILPALVTSNNTNH